MRAFLLGALGLAGCGANVVIDAAGEGGAGGGPPLSCTIVPAGDATSLDLGIGSVCEATQPECYIADACCGARARCSGGVWTPIGGGGCSGCVPCGAGLTCAPGAVCVEQRSGTSTNPVGYACAPNPCGTTALDCSCAASLCVGQTAVCKDTTIDRVRCTATHP